MSKTPKNGSGRPGLSKRLYNPWIYLAHTLIVSGVLFVAFFSGLLTQSGKLPNAANKSLVSTSRYISWMTGGVESDSEKAYKLGCKDATNGGHLSLIAFGRQVSGGTRSFDGAEVLYDYNHLKEVAASYAKGVSECTKTPWNVVVATSNYRLYDVNLAREHGLAWAELIEELSKTELLNVSFSGGIDLEPGWGGAKAARAWVEEYKRLNVPLVSNASADGCPMSGAGGRCANGWDVDLMVELIWGREMDSVLPQIYRHDGVQSRQWATIARNFKKKGGVPRFAGVMTQVRACQLVQNSSCKQLNMHGLVAKEQLTRELKGITTIDVATDIGWG